LSGRGLCDELITRPEESYRLCCVVVCDLETSRVGAPYIYDISRLWVNENLQKWDFVIHQYASICYALKIASCFKKLYFCTQTGHFYFKMFGRNFGL